MDTISQTHPLGRRHRRSYERAFKADVVAACQQPGISVAAVALSHGLNANLLRRWVAEHERFGHHDLGQDTAATRVAKPTPPAAFVPVRLPGPPAPVADIRIELRRGAMAVNVSWPVGGGGRLRRLATGSRAMIRIEAAWLAVDPMDMRAGADTALARVVQVFGGAQPHHAYLFANRRGNRMKVLVHDGVGVWLAARRLNQGRFVWPRGSGTVHMQVTHEQLHALALGLPWQRMGNAGIITVL